VVPDAGRTDYFDRPQSVGQGQGFGKKGRDQGFFIWLPGPNKKAFEKKPEEADCGRGIFVAGKVRLLRRIPGCCHVNLETSATC
jgi:hypothetical protein